MDQPVNLKGKLPETRIIEVFSAVLKSGFKNCNILFFNNGFTRTLKVKDNRVIFIYSDDPGESFMEFLRSNTELSGSDLKRAENFSEKNGIRLGKSLCQMDLVNYKDMWQLVTDHQKELLDNICKMNNGEYSIYEHSDDVNENIRLDINLSNVILHLIRVSDHSDMVRDKFEIVNKIFIKNRQPELPFDIMNFEQHVIELCIKYRNLDSIIKESELKEADTLKFVLFFYLIDVISTEKSGIQKGQQINDLISVNISFSSYEEALKHYNIKFEMIFKILSKEIGPVALSILSKSIDDIRDNLPVFLKGAELDKNGKLMDKKILKKVWYHDFENHSAEFVRGLEELLYAQIFAVKKNLGIEYENQILKWLKGTGS